ncbi:MAG: BlaI/MecI/CopY family transcriptional regulator [Candidatus Bathyarchaeota archaeon]|nr:BlaI/MecI/CopY family transcriptional regulator [Candidatus Bathyarchaeota archaeon]
MAEIATPIEKEIIEYLSLNPNQNTQQIQRGLVKADKNYPTVKNALERLEKKNYVETHKGKSKKNLTIKFYKLSPRGVSIALGLNREENLMRTLANYKDAAEAFSLLKQFANYLDTQLSIKLLRQAGLLAVRQGKKYNTPRDMITPIMLNAVSGLSDWTQEELTKLAEAALKIEKVRLPLKDAVALMDKLFSGKG